MSNLLLFSFILSFIVINGSVIPSYDESLQHRIIGGQDAPEGGVPYQASIRSLFDFHFCGGSILNRRWILTAGHCLVGESIFGIRIVVGTNSLVIGGDTYSADKIIIHEDYDSETITNDIGLVHLSKDIKFSETVQPIQLPEIDTAAGSTLFLTGWGITYYPDERTINLQMINLTALSVHTCQDIHSDVKPSQICTLTKAGEGACFGDSGGPLVEGNHVVGIVSWGVPCAKGYPDVHTRVYSFKNWILEKIGSYELENLKN